MAKSPEEKNKNGKNSFWQKPAKTHLLSKKDPQQPNLCPNFKQLKNEFNYQQDQQPKL